MSPRTYTHAVAAIGADRPGMVASLGEALLEVGASIDDSSMTILGGHFAMLLLVDTELDAAALDATLAPMAREFALLLEVREAAPAGSAAADAGEAWAIAAYGPDRPGLVVALARVLADAGANITDFGSRVTEGGTFAMWFNVVLPAGADAAGLGERLAGAGSALGLDVSLHRTDDDEL
jgi:glycine cleavage system transcriptional repressor